MVGRSRRKATPVRNLRHSQNILRAPITRDRASNANIPPGPSIRVRSAAWGFVGVMGPTTQDAEAGSQSWSSPFPPASWSNLPKTLRSSSSDQGNGRSSGGRGGVVETCTPHGVARPARPRRSRRARLPELRGRGMRPRPAAAQHKGPLFGAPSLYTYISSFSFMYANILCEIRLNKDT